ncbi:purine-nucleoside phosphorylase [Ignisphaera sp. 4213-co]|uniref:Purine-nucleoside phosphorylase n=1 Tax=Ignisphaera cupida TaxID=3050454 RepID=A0ABD4Z6N9_9CREN|nr:purine-nucleoside phosphorylase [Ignisphaera sp. 4213-co]MDK6028991.1 purine-nucleoside phosphorylase [Ignisphaera sp. 4213-co]
MERLIGPIHIKAKKGDVAERVIVAGDPARVEQVSKMLENPRVVNTNRGFIIYTGAYKGVPVSVAVHGVGHPSSMLVVEELAMLGAKVVIRFGTCGAMVKGLKIGDIVIPTAAAYYPGGAFYQYLKEAVCTATAPHFDVLKTLVEETQKAGVNYVLGPVVSSDAFYAEDPEFVKKWTSRGIVAVEMECAGLFMLGAMRNLKTGALLMVSDSLVEELGFASAEELREYVNRASKIVLEALIKISA